MSKVVSRECRGRYTMWHHLRSQKGLISAVCVILISLDLREGHSFSKQKKGSAAVNSNLATESKSYGFQHQIARFLIPEHKKLSIRTISIQTASQLQLQSHSKFFLAPSCLFLTLLHCSMQVVFQGGNSELKKKKSNHSPNTIKNG